ncbi:MAG: threonine aldolase [Hyphomonadaceae bacterium]|nr:MAG: threonine aldolase [Hyphomonadaceae bacterium]KAF0186054.1 MAG: threonine aldolase [Hyphomonadaceae bacterium]
MFGSDNQTGAHPYVMAAIKAADVGRAPSYGSDEITTHAERLVKQIFETEDLDFYIVTSGSAANGLALASLCPRHGAVLCHSHAHIIADEGNGPEWFTGGARLIGVGQGNEKLQPQHLQAAAASHPKEFVHGPQIAAVSFTNLDENGQNYRPNEIKALAEVAHANGWLVHCDGARFANAVDGTGASAAELSWKSGVDALSFGLTKNGALMAESFILFGAARNKAAKYMRKSTGQLVSKHRFLAAQFVVMLDGGLWLELAHHANQMALKLGARFKELGIEIIGEIGGNEVFAKLPPEKAKELQTRGISCYVWPPLGENVYRFVCSYATLNCDILAVR